MVWTNSRKWGNPKEPNLKYPHLNSTLPSSKFCSSNFLLRSRLPDSTRPGCWHDKEIKRLVMTSRFCLLSCLTSASAEISPAAEKHGTSPTAPVKKQCMTTGPYFANTKHEDLKLNGSSMGAPVEAPTAPLSDAERPITNSVPGQHGTWHTISSGRIAGSLEESNAKTQ